MNRRLGTAWIITAILASPNLLADTITVRQGGRSHSHNRAEEREPPAAMKKAEKKQGEEKTAKRKAERADGAASAAK